MNSLLPKWLYDKEFIRHYEVESRVFNRFGIYASIVTWIAVMICVPAVLNTGLFFDIGNYLPLTLFPLFFYIIFITHNERYKKLYQPLTALANALAGLMALNLGAGLLKNCIAVTCISVIILCAFFLLRLRLWYGIAATMTYLIPFIVYMTAFASEFSRTDRNSAILIVLFTEFISIAAGYIIEEMAAKIYYQNREINKQAEELKIQADELSQNIKALHETQAQLVMSQKLAVVGHVAAGVAHEINSPLAAIKSNLGMQKIVLEAVLGESGQDPDNRLSNFISMNEVSEQAIERIYEVVKSLKNFARLDESQYKEVDIHEGIESTLKLLTRELRDEISIIRDYGNTPLLFCYAMQINQVFYNLLLNSIQAIEGKGSITIKTWYEDKKIIISIKDSGTGIKSENLDKIYDPGFTTKGVGIGRGLGLSTSYKIVENHKGSITVNSKWKEGTEVIVQLSIMSESVQN